jgi:RNA polymerase sigma-70 factor (ECF subfamily)
MSVDDDAIVTALYRAYRDPLLTFVLRLTAGDRGQAEDVVQETMVRAWREAGRLDLSGPSLLPWLTTVARRIVIDEHRRRQLRPAVRHEDSIADAAVDDESTATLLRVAVAEAMQELSRAHREVVSETILRDRTACQAAEVLGIPVGTVKSRLYYALRALQIILAERGLRVVPGQRSWGGQPAEVMPRRSTCPRP